MLGGIGKPRTKAIKRELLVFSTRNMNVNSHEVQRFSNPKVPIFDCNLKFSCSCTFPWVTNRLFPLLGIFESRVVNFHLLCWHNSHATCSNLQSKVKLHKKNLNPYLAWGLKLQWGKVWQKQHQFVTCYTRAGSNLWFWDAFEKAKERRWIICYIVVRFTIFVIFFRPPLVQGFSEMGGGLFKPKKQSLL